MIAAAACAVALAGCGGADSGAGALEFAVHWNGVDGRETVEIRILGAGFSCPSPIEKTRAQQIVALPVCVGSPSSSCVLRRASLLSGDAVILKDIPGGPVFVFVAVLDQGADRAGCTPATVSPSTITTVQVALGAL